MGVIDSLVLRRLIDEYNHCYTHKLLIVHQKDNKEYFLLSKEYFYYNYKITRSQLDAILRLFKNLGLVETRLIGNPAKTHFTLNTDLINEFIFSLLNMTNTEIASKDKLRLFLDANTEIEGLNKLNTLSLSNSTNKIAITNRLRDCNVEQTQSLQPQTNSINTNNNNSIIVDKPTYEEVCLYFNSKGFNDNLSERFFNYYERLNWNSKKGNIISDWKLTASNWCTEEEKIKNPYIAPKKQPTTSVWHKTIEEIIIDSLKPNAKEIFINEYGYPTWSDFKFQLDIAHHKHNLDFKNIYEL